MLVSGEGKWKRGLEKGKELKRKSGGYLIKTDKEYLFSCL